MITGAGVSALTPVALLGMLTTACRSAAKLERWAFLLLPRASVSVDGGATALLIAINLTESLWHWRGEESRNLPLAEKYFFQTIVAQGLTRMVAAFIFMLEVQDNGKDTQP